LRDILQERAPHLGGGVVYTKEKQALPHYGDGFLEVAKAAAEMMSS